MDDWLDDIYGGAEVLGDVNSIHYNFNKNRGDYKNDDRDRMFLPEDEGSGNF